MHDAGFEYRIELPIRNEWENVDLIRTSILNCCTAIFSEVDGASSAVAIIAAELLENAMKYGDWNTAGSALHLRMWGNAKETRVEVENPIDTGSSNVDELLKTIDWLNTFPSAEEGYRARLKEVASSPPGVSKLGLARIAYEGNCSLRAEIDGDVLRVTTVTQVKGA
jgi:hypothetical protein